MMWGLSLCALGLPVALAGACGDSGVGKGKGTLRVLLEAEETITEGLSVGNDPEDSGDYAVRFTKYLVTIGHVRLARSGARDERELAGPFVADMTKVGEAGVELGVFKDLRAGEWASFGFETPMANNGAKALKGVSASDLEEMIEHGYTYWIEGIVERSEAEGGPLTFVVQTDAVTAYRNCEYEGEPGVTVVADGTATATITLHGDHLFFNTFPTGSEGTIRRMAGWLVKADLNGDGKVTTDELAEADATDLFPRSSGYSLDGAPIPIETGLDFVRAQLATQGHYRGEGECIWEFEGETSSHDHD